MRLEEVAAEISTATATVEAEAEATLTTVTSFANRITVPLTTPGIHHREQTTLSPCLQPFQDSASNFQASTDLKFACLLSKGPSIRLSGGYREHFHGTG